MHHSSSLRFALLVPFLMLPLSGCGSIMGGLESVAVRHNARTAGVGADLDRPAQPGAPDDQVASRPADSPGEPASVDLPASDENDAAPQTGADELPAAEPATRDPEPAAKSGFWPRVIFAAPLATATATATTKPLPSATRPPTSTPDPLASAGNPIRLEIPALAVDAPIEAVGLTRERAMDVPKGWMNAGWYVNGFRPGEPGNAVVAGHLDSNTGGPAIFWDLNKLLPGDEVYIHYESGLRLGFRVEGNQLYNHDADGAIIDAIFGPSQTADLNLVTCYGPWDYGEATYSERLVVFATLIEGQVEVPAGQ